VIDCVNQSRRTDSGFSLDDCGQAVDILAMDSALSLVLSRPVRLEAIDVARNISRCYRIDAHRDLFGAVTVDYAWGRIGQRGQSRSATFTQDAQAERFVARLLRRRASARARIGVAYRDVSG